MAYLIDNTNIPTIFSLKECSHAILGPNTNYWGYKTTIAIFSAKDIMVKTITPRKTRIVKYFDNWDDCADFIDLINADRRY
tara:strand:+ start:209 stop:451 length:243 start_codon:yes stop_codon:yes gene_type:complete